MEELLQETGFDDSDEKASMSESNNQIPDNPDRKMKSKLSTRDRTIVVLGIMMLAAKQSHFNFGDPYSVKPKHRL